MPVIDRSAWPRWARGATSPWVLSPLLVFALLIGAFLGYGAYSRSRPTHYARGGDAFGAPAPTDSVSTKVAARGGAKPPKGAKPKASSAAGHHKGRGGQSAGGRTSTRSGSSNSGRSSSGGSSSGGSSSGGSSSGGQTFASPQTGSYTLAVSGSEHVRFGPVDGCSNTFPSSAQLTIQPASGEPAGSYDFDTRYYPGSPNKHDERHIYRYTSSGVVLSYEEATVTCGGVKQSSTVSYSPAQLRVPAPLKVGESWHTSGGDSNRTETGDFQVTGTATLTYNGRSYTTYVIDASISMSGGESGSRDQRWWYSPDLGLPLKWHESLSGSRSGATYSEDVTAEVVSGP